MGAAMGKVFIVVPARQAHATITKWRGSVLVFPACPVTCRVLSCPNAARYGPHVSLCSSASLSIQIEKKKRAKAALHEDYACSNRQQDRTRTRCRTGQDRTGQDRAAQDKINLLRRIGQNVRIRVYEDKDHGRHFRLNVYMPSMRHVHQSLCNHLPTVGQGDG